MLWLFISLGLLLIVIIWYVATYNRLIRAKALTGEAWAGIDTQLKRRHDLIPNLVETVKGYGQYEQKVLADLTALRGKAMSAGGFREKAEEEEEEEEAGNPIGSRLALHGQTYRSQRKMEFSRSAAPGTIIQYGKFNIYRHMADTSPDLIGQSTLGRAHRPACCSYRLSHGRRLSVPCGIYHLRD